MSTAIERVKKLESEFGPASQLKLFPQWGSDYRGMSKSLARSALFAVRDKRVPRERYDNAVIASLQNVEIRYSGIELRQDDHDVFMQLCHMARDEQMGSAVSITGIDALRDLKWGSSLEDYDRLRACYTRMLEGTIYVTVKGARNIRVTGSHLFQSVTAEQGTGTVEGLTARWTIRLNPELAGILTGDEMTLILWARHEELPPLAKWLYRFFATHETPFPYKAETLHMLCGSRQADMAAFRQKLKKSLQELVDGRFIASFNMGPKPSYLVTVTHLEQPRIA